MSDTGLEVTTNGTGPGDADDIDEAVVFLQRSVEIRQKRRGELQAQLDVINDELRKREKALNALTGESKRPGPKQGRAKGVSISGGKSIGVEKLAQVEACVRQLASEQDEFRQVDVRARLGNVTSSTAATSFEALRQKNLIRVARVEGNNKYYRLTREALKTPAEQ